MYILKLVETILHTLIFIIITYNLFCRPIYKIIASFVTT